MPQAPPRTGPPLTKALSIAVAEHPHLELGAFTTTFQQALADVTVPASLEALLAIDAPAPLSRSEQLRRDVRDMLRHGGHKPTGRGKPASEYLVRAATETPLRSINLAVDACNVVSLHSGLPISVVDVDRLAPPLDVAVVNGPMEYVFNPSGQTMRLTGLLCLHDSVGPCANAVKDSQRTKTGPETRQTLSLVWGCKSHREQTEGAVEWYRQLVESAGLSTHAVEFS